MLGVRKAQGVVLSVVMASGCGSEGSSAEERQAANAVASGYAVIEGVVVLAEEVSVESSQEVASTLNQPPPPRDCSNSEATSWTEDALVGAGGFALKNAKRQDARTHELEIDNCRLEERLLPVTVGDRIKVVNKGSYPFMPTFGASDPTKVLLENEALSFRVTEAGMHEIRCSFTAPCGLTRLAAFHHPIHARLDEGGRFRLLNVPAGVKVQVSAWHPQLTAEVQTVVLKAGETRKLKFEMRPGKAAGLMVASSQSAQRAKAAN